MDDHHHLPNTRLNCPSANPLKYSLNPRLKIRIWIIFVVFEGSLYILGVYDIIPVSMDIQIQLFKATTQTI